MIAYHGSRVEIKNFQVQDVTGHDRYGPGIYFTNLLSTARVYGHYVHIVDIDITKFATEKHPINTRKIKSLCNLASNDVLENWDENPLIAKRKLTESMISTSSDMTEALNNIWADVFLKNNIRATKAFTANGYDGIIVKIKGNENYYITYNESTITLLDIQRA